MTNPVTHTLLLMTDETHQPHHHSVDTKSYNRRKSVLQWLCVEFYRTAADLGSDSSAT